MLPSLWDWSLLWNHGCLSWSITTIPTGPFLRTGKRRIINVLNKDSILFFLRLENECIIAINGPADVHCDGVVNEALVSYWRQRNEKYVGGQQGGHWVRRWRDIKKYAVSEAVDTLINKPPNVPFML